MNFFLLMVIISDYTMKKFGSAPGEAGFAASAFIIGALAVRFITGNLLIRAGYKETLALGVVTGFIMSMLYLWVNNIYFLLVVRFFHGASFGIATSSTATIVADIVPRGRSGEGIAYYSMSQTLATAIGPFLAMFFTRNGSYIFIFTICVIAMALSLLLISFLSNRKKELTPEQIKDVKSLKPGNFIELPVVPISVVCMVVFLCYSSIVSFLAVYAQKINLVDAASFFFVIYALVVLISRPFVGRLFDAKGENKIIYPSILIFAAGMFLFSRSHTGLELLLAAVLVGFGFGAISFSIMAIAVKITPPHRLGMANSTYFIFCDLGMGIGPSLVGFIISLIGYRGMYSVIAVILLSCMFLYYFFHGRSAGQGIPIEDKQGKTLKQE